MNTWDAMRAAVALIPSPKTAEEKRVWSLVYLLDFALQEGQIATLDGEVVEIASVEDFEQLYPQHKGDPTWRRLTTPAAIARRAALREKSDKAVAVLFGGMNL